MATTKKKRAVSKAKKTPAKTAAPVTETALTKTPEKEVVKRAAVRHAKVDLFVWNKWLAIIYAIQGIALIVVSGSKSLPVFSTYLTKSTLPDNGMVHATQRLFDANIVALVVGMFFVAAIAHALLAGVCRSRYEAELAEGTNRLHWLTFGASSLFLLVIVSLLTGISDVAALCMISALSIGQSIFAYLAAGQKTAVRQSYAISMGASVVVWLAILFTAVSAAIYGTHVASFMYGVYATAVIGFAAQAAVTYAAVNKKGKWANAYYAELSYALVALITVSAVAWQVFAGALRP